MRGEMLMNCLWYEDLTPEELADALGLTPEDLFRKIFERSDFTEEEMRKIVMLLGLTEDETERIFFA